MVGEARGWVPGEHTRGRVGRTQVLELVAVEEEGEAEEDHTRERGDRKRVLVQGVRRSG